MKLQLALGHLTLKLALGDSDNDRKGSENTPYPQSRGNLVTSNASKALISINLEGLYYLRLLIYTT